MKRINTSSFGSFFFGESYMRKVISSFWTQNFKSYLATSIKAPPVAKNDCPKMIGNSRFSYTSRTIKSMGIVNLLTMTQKSSRMLRGYLTVLSANYSTTFVGLKSPTPSLATIEDGIKLILDPKSQRALSNYASLME